MELNKYNEITGKLKTALKPARYVHTLGVAFTAAALSMAYGLDVDKALLAGLLHDCAKCFSDEEKFELCREGNVELSKWEIENPALIHAKLGVYIARRDYGVEDKEILDAIRTHTTGEPEMSMLQRIIFTADLIEPNRDDIIPEMADFWELAFKNIDEAIYRITKNQLEFLRSQPGKVIDPITVATHEYYKALFEQEK